jgi:hypothetical protein
MLNSLLSSCWLKLGRAAHHAEAFEAKLRLWRESAPYAAVIEPNVDGSRYGIKVKVRTPPPLDEFALIVGDCIRSLRASLDHMVYAIAVHECGRNPIPNEDKLQFPIVDSPEKFPGQLYRLQAISANVGVIDAIRASQPYNRWHQRFPPLLGVLRDLDNTDKHKLVSVVFASVLGGKFYNFEGISPDCFEVGYHSGSVEDGTEVAWLTPKPAKLGIRFKHDCSVVIALRHAAGPDGRDFHEAYDVLSCLRNEVVNVVSRFADL